MRLKSFFDMVAITQLHRSRDTVRAHKERGVHAHSDAREEGLSIFRAMRGAHRERVRVQREAWDRYKPCTTPLRWRLLRVEMRRSHESRAMRPRARAIRRVVQTRGAQARALR